MSWRSGCTTMGTQGSVHVCTVSCAGSMRIALNLHNYSLSSLLMVLRTVPWLENIPGLICTYMHWYV